MKYTLSLSIILVVVLAGVLNLPVTSHASIPNLSVTSSGSGDTVQLTVYGDTYSTVYLNYQSSNYGYQSQSIGTTNSNGYLTTNLGSSSYSISPGSQIYVTINNQQSNNVSWPYYNNYNSNSNNLSLNRTSVYLTVGQAASITISGGNSSYSMYPNSQNIYIAAISGNVLTIIGQGIGSDSLRVCNYGSSSCASVYITVANSPNYYYNNYQPILTSSPVTFSQSNVNLSASQSINVSIFGGSSGYYNVAYNSNTNSLQASINGNVITLTSLSNNSVNVVVICSTINNCGAITVTVNSGSVLGAQNNWTYCGSENQSCTFYGTQTVRYGANGSYFYKTLNGGASCSNTVFGDPLFGVVKQCSYGGQY